ncbi:MAG: D-Ala-D-Ala carboxypeptidase family metallohydrolase [candidate division Zixibacteria bacterium]
MDLSERLSSNFTLGELLASDRASDSAELIEQQENPPEAVVESLRFLVETTLQPLRGMIASPIHINSGYRCPEVNRMVGSSSRSHHLYGMAADCRLSAGFLSDPDTLNVRSEIEELIKEKTGRVEILPLNEAGYLFALACLNLEKLEITQLVHEHGEAIGQPAWVHIAARPDEKEGIVTFLGEKAPAHLRRVPPEDAILSLTKRPEEG